MMGFFLKPVMFVISLASNLGGMLMGSIQKIREMILWIRTATSGLVADIFGVFINTLIQFQKMIIGMKSMVSQVSKSASTILIKKCRNFDDFTEDQGSQY